MGVVSPVFGGGASATGSGGPPANDSITLAQLLPSIRATLAKADTAIQAIATGSIGSAQIADGAVTSDDLSAAIKASLAKADSALQGSITGAQITDGSVALADLSSSIQASLAHADTALQSIGAGAVGSTEVADGSVALADLNTALQSAIGKANSALQTIGASSVGSTEVTDGSIALVDLASSVQAQLALASTALQTVPTNSVGSAQITDGTVAMADLNAALQTNLGLASTAVQPGGNVATATKLATPRAINGVNFDGSAAVTLTNRIVALLTAATTLANAAASTGGVEYVYVSTAAAGVPTLPTAVSNINRYTWKNASGGPIVMATTSSQTIDGSTTLTLQDGSSVDLVSDNANWRIV